MFYWPPLPYFMFDVGGSDTRARRLVKDAVRLSQGTRPARAALRAATATAYLTYNKFAASGECNEPRRVAVRRVGWQRTARLCESQLQRPIHHPRFARFVLGAPPRAGAFGHSDWAASTPIRERRFLAESRYSLSTQSPTKSKAQSSTQFSTPCQPHCGSAGAPPRLPSPAGISSRFCSPQNE